MGDDGTEFHESGIDPSLLVDGDNILAVEVHQATPGSSDLSFDAYLVADLDSTAGVLANDSDPEGTPLVATVLVGPADGTLCPAV